MTQDFFVKLFRNAARYEPRGHFTTWFYRVLANLCFDALRKRKRRRKVQDVQIDPIAAEGTELEPLARPIDPSASLRAGRPTTPCTPRSADLPAAGARGPRAAGVRRPALPRDRRGDGLSLNEVKVLLHRGRKLLARRLSQTAVGRDWADGVDDQGPPDHRRWGRNPPGGER